MNYLKIDQPTGKVIGFIQSSLPIAYSENGTYLIEMTQDVDRTHNWEYKDGKLIDMGKLPVASETIKVGNN